MKKINYFIAVSFLIILGSLSSCENESKSMTGIALSTENLTLDVDVISEVIAFPLPWDAEVLEKFTWSSANESVARVNSKGEILGVDPGNTTITCHYQGFTATLDVTVNAVETLQDKIDALGANGYWEFENTANLTEKSIGNDLIFVEDNKNILSIEGPRFDNKAIRIPRDPYEAGVTGTYVQCNHGFTPKNGEIKINEYTVMWDIRLPDEEGMPESSYYSLMSTRTLDNSSDQDFAIRRAGSFGIGSLGYAPEGTLTKGRWYRVVLSAKAGESFTYYVEGRKVYDGNAANAPVDGRFSLLPEGVLFFSDEDGDDSTIDASAIAVWNRALGASDVAKLGNVRQTVIFSD